MKKLHWFYWVLLLLFLTTVTGVLSCYAQFRPGVIQRTKRLGGNTNPNPDTQAPTAPTALSASSITETSFTLSWTASTDNIAVTGYDIFRDGNQVFSNQNVTNISVTGLSAGTTYLMTVRARDAVGNTANSSSYSVTTSSASSVPVLEATWLLNFGNQFSTAVTNYNNLFPVSFPVASGTAYNNLKRNDGSTSSTGFQLVTSISGGGGSGGSCSSGTYNANAANTWWRVQNNEFFTGKFTGLVSGKSYRLYFFGGTNQASNAIFVVNGVERTLSEQNNCSTRVSFIDITAVLGEIEFTMYRTSGYYEAGLSVLELQQWSSNTPPDTEAPVAPTALSASNITGNTFDLSYGAASDNVGVIRYDIFRNGVLMGSSTSTTFSATGLNTNTTYSITAKAVDAAGNISPASTALNVTTNNTASPSVIPLQYYQILVETGWGFENKKSSAVVNQEKFIDGNTATKFNPFLNWNHPDMLDSVAIGIPIGKNYNVTQIRLYDDDAGSCASGKNLKIQRLAGFTANSNLGSREPVWVDVVNTDMSGSIGWKTFSVSFTNDTLRLVILGTNSNPGNYSNIPSEIEIIGSPTDATTFPAEPTEASYTLPTMDARIAAVRQMDSPDDFTPSRGYVAAGYYSYGGNNVNAVNFSAPFNNSSHITGKYEKIYRQGLAQNSYICMFNWTYWMNGTAENSYNFDKPDTAITNNPNKISSYRRFGQLARKFAQVLGVFVKKFQPLNEPDKDWQGKINNLTTFQIFLIESISNDGHNNYYTDAGIKNGCADCELFSANLWSATPRQLQADLWFSSLYRLRKPGGGIDLPYVATCFDTYTSNVTTIYGVQGQYAVSPESRGANSFESLVSDYRSYVQKFAPGLLVVASEEGNDFIGPQAPFDVPGQSDDYTQTAWKVRSFFVGKLDIHNHFQDRDGSPTGTYYYQRSGWQFNNYSDAGFEDWRTWRPIGYDVWMLSNRLTGFREVVGDRTVSGNVRKWHFVHKDNSNFHAYAVWNATENNSTTTNYTFAVSGTNAWSHAGWLTNSKTGVISAAAISGGNITVPTVYEMPVIYFTLNSGTFPTYFKYETQINLAGKTISGGTNAANLIDEQAKCLTEDPMRQLVKFEAYANSGGANFMLDLGANYEVTKICMQTSYTNQFTFQTSTDGVNWTTQSVTPKTIFYKNWSYYHIESPCPTPGTCYGQHGQGVTTRYVRAINSTGLTAGEMAIYGYTYNNGQ